MGLSPNDLANAIGAALPGAWQDIKGVPFPGGDPKDRQVLFLAIARALLRYLHDNQSGLIVQMDLRIGNTTSTATISNLSLNITGV